MRSPFFLFLCMLFAIEAVGLHSENAALKAAPDSPARKKSICLNMIVKNESHVIERCFTSVLPFIDYWVIVDTGSTDGTQELIRKFMKEKNIPGELYERPWVNFGHNREEALVLAKDKCDYLMFMDADDILTYPKDYQLPELIYDIYLIEGVAKEMKYHLLTIVKASLNWHWHDPIHEYLGADDAKVAAILPKIQYVYMHDGARSKDPLHVQKDIEILKDCLAKSPNNPRYLFCLGQAYRSLGEKEQSLMYFKKRTEVEGGPDETYWAMLQVALLLEEKGEEAKIVDDAFQKAYEFRPSRHEVIYYIAQRARERGENQKAYEMASRGVELPLTLDTSNAECHAYDATFFEYAYNAYLLGRYQDCLKGTKHVLQSNQLPARFLEITKQIHKDSLEKLREQRVLKILDQYSNS